LRLGGRESYRTIAVLIADAADALEHAHTVGIVHRDVKPGNLMVDGSGKVWVTDFGLARVGPDVGLTMTGDLLGTLRYMAPEQALAKHGLVEHRADVYGLGATLYELLTGKPAVGGEDKQEILRRLAFEEPVALRKVDKAVPAELETITLKCLAKESAERYATAGELAADLRRWLDDKPIQARRPSVRQRIGRWTRRHTGLTAALGLAVGLFIAGTWAWERQKTQAEAAARTVANEADQLREADRLWEALLAAKRAADQLPGFGGDAGLRRSIADRIAELELLGRLEEARSEQTAVLADGGMFDVQLAAPLFQQAFLDYGVDVLNGAEPVVVEALRRPTIAPRVCGALFEWERIADDPATKTRLGGLAEALDSDPRRLVSRIRRAEATKDVAGLKHLAGEAAADLPPPAVIVRLAYALIDASPSAEAEKLMCAGQERYPDDFWVNYELAVVLSNLGRLQIAEAVRFCSAAAVLRPHSAGAWMGLGAVLSKAGRYGQAVSAYRKAAAMAPDQAQIHVGLGRALKDVGRPVDAEATLRRAVDLSPKLAVAHMELGLALKSQGRLADAEASYRRAIALNAGYALAYSNLGALLMESKRFAEAEKALLQAISLNAKLATAHMNLGNLYARDLNRPADGVKAHRRAVELDPADPVCRLNLGNSLKEMGRLKDAEVEYRKACELGPDDFNAQYNLGTILTATSRLKDAEAAYRRAIDLKPRIVQSHCELGWVLLQQGRFSEALAERRICHDLCVRQRGRKDPSDEWVRYAERYAALETKLLAMQAGVATTNALEQLAIAQMCQTFKKDHLTAARFYAAAYSADPGLAEKLTSHRYNAACSAVLASIGRANDAENLGSPERLRLRRQALGWLQAELGAHSKRADMATERPKVRETMQHWQKDVDLAGARDAVELAKLPETDSVAWQKFWSDVVTLERRCDAPTRAEPKPSDKP
jgi:tetratricopeptide (TPR) repeat protein